MSLARKASGAAVKLVGSRHLEPDHSPAFDFVPRPRANPAQLAPADRRTLGKLGRVAQRLRAKDISCTELLEEALAAVELHDASLNAFAELLDAPARVQAKALDEELAGDGCRGPLHGIPISIKDVIHVASVPTRAGSSAYRVVPEKDASAVALLRAAGAVFVGKATTHEFALGVTSPQSRNPHDPTRIPGGSSGGSAISIATGMCLGSLGTDTRASIRVPAALSGVVGFKGTLGLVPADGLVQLSWSMDHVAPMAGSVADAGILFDVLAGTQLSTFCGSNASALRIGVPGGGIEGADDEVLSAFTRARSILDRIAGDVSPVGGPDAADFEVANAAGLLVSRCEAAAYHRRLGLERGGYWPETRDQLDAADEVAATDYLDAQRLRAILAHRMLRVFDDIDVLAMPTCLVPAPKVEQADDYLLILSRNAILWSFIGFPAVSIPCGTTAQGLPIGLQLVAPPQEESSLVALGAAFESAFEPDRADSSA
ncbi:amidase [soil metagenome]